MADWDAKCSSGTRARFQTKWVRQGSPDATNPKSDADNVDYAKYDIIAEQLIAVVKPCDHFMISLGDKFFLIKPPEYSHGFRVVCLNGPPPPTDEVAAEPVAEVVAWRYGGMDWMSGKQDHSSVAPRSLILAEQYEKLTLVKKAEFGTCGILAICVVIRLLKKRDLDKSPCPPSDAADAFTITVKGASADETFVVSALRLQQVSPVIRAMLRNDTRERTERAMVVEDAEPEEFRAFLEVVSWELPGVLPNPRTVLALLTLADRYQVQFVRDLCEKHLQHCAEINFVTKLELIDQYGLHKLKSLILTTHPEQLRPLCKKYYRQLRDTLSRDLFDELLENAM